MKPGKKITILSWALYDFANTIFAMNIVSLYFARWVTMDKGGRDILYSIALSGSMLLAALIMPVMGAISDRFRKRIPFLVFFTVVAVVFTGAIGVMDKLFLGLLFFAVANFCYQLAGIFYNALLPEICDKEEMGRVSGFGVCLGYMGTIVGLLAVWPFVKIGGRAAAFLPTAGLFLLFSLPCFLLVKDKRGLPFTKPESGFAGEAFRRLADTLKHVKDYRNLVLFLIVAFLAINAINTILAFTAVYAGRVLQFSDYEFVIFIIVSTVFAIISSFSSGFITDRFGAKRTLLGVLFGWIVTILLATLSMGKVTFWIVGPMAGICLAATWTASRVLLIRLAPPEKLGEIFGIFGLISRFAVLSLLVWGLAEWGFGFLGLARYRVALLTLLIFMVPAFLILRKLPE